jgi:hypothetical protein
MLGRSVHNVGLTADLMFCQNSGQVQPILNTDFYTFETGSGMISLDCGYDLSVPRTRYISYTDCIPL